MIMKSENYLLFWLNFFSVMSHCWSRGMEVIIGSQSAMQLEYMGGLAQVSLFGSS